MLLSRINKKAPMKIIICSPKGNIHKKTQVDISSSVLARLNKVSNSSPLTSSINRRGRNKIDKRKSGVKHRSKVHRIVDELLNCGSPNQKLLTLKEVLQNPDPRLTNELISSSTSNSSSNTLNHSPLLFYLMKKFKTSTCQSWSTLISKAGIYGEVDHNEFHKSSKGIKSKSRATNIIIESVLNMGSYKQQCLVLNDVLAHFKLIYQAADCSYFGKKVIKFIQR